MFMIPPALPSAISEAGLTRLRQFLALRAGQQLSDNRIIRIENSLRTQMAAAGLDRLDQLIEQMAADPFGLLATQCLDAMLNNETSFFRDRALFALLTGALLTEIRTRRMDRKRLRIWSAACSTGQEVYSLAMAIREAPELWRDWHIEIIGSDLSHHAVARAREGQFTQMEIQRGLPATYMLRYFRKNGTDWQAHENLRGMVSFHVHNAMDTPPFAAGFDLVLCRNLLIYLYPEAQVRLIGQLRAAMADDAFLMLGATETVLGLADDLLPARAYRGFYEKRKTPHGGKRSTGHGLASLASDAPAPMISDDEMGSVTKF